MISPTSLRVSSVCAPLGFGLALLTAASGCLSDRYQIPDDEVQRQLQLPPEQRGQGLRVIQNIGDRAAPAVVYGAPPVAPPGYGPQGGYPPPGGYAQSESHVGVFVGVNVGSGPSYSSPPPQAGPRVRTASPTVNPREGTPVGRGTPGGGAGAAPGGSSGGGGFRNGGSGSSAKSSSGDDAQALLVLAVVAAIGVTIGAAATEGARYDGKVVVAPNQNVYLRRRGGGELVQRLDYLTPQDLTGISEVEMSDAEGYGMGRLGREPLNRKGFAFKLDVGSLATRLDPGVASGRGPGANIQFGYFFTRNLGLLLTTALTGGTDSQSRSFARAQIGGELQGFLPALGPVHLGGFGNLATFNTALDGSNDLTGTAWGFGGLLEIDLTTRLALDFRVGWGASRTANDGTAADGLGVTAGLAIY